jgi:hypothetical protein
VTASRERSILIVIVAAAVGLRLVRIGALSFAGDEETTTLAALALLEGWPPTLPGGLVYIRGLPFTLLEAAMVAGFGVGESSLRLLPALFAGPRVALIWWLARPLLGGPLALASAGLLAVAPLDVELSRTARMYSLFALLDLAFVAVVVRGSWGAGRWTLASVTGVLSVLVHTLGVTHAPVPWAAAMAPGLGSRLRAGLVALGGTVLFVFVLFRRAERAGWAGIGIEFEGMSRGLPPVSAHLGRIASIFEASSAAAVVVAGLALALVLGARGVAAQRMPLGRLAAAAALAAFAVASPLLGAILVLGLGVVERIPVRDLFARAPATCLSGFVVTLAWGVAALVASGATASGVEGAARLLLGLPAPNWVDLVRAAPLFCALAGVGVVVAFDRAARAERSAPWLALIAAALAPAVLTGLLARREGLRYHLHELAPLIVLALLAADATLRRVVQQKRIAFVLAVALVAIALRPDHSLRVLLRQHGPVASPFVELSVAPDHRGAAGFVQKRASPEEWIAAEDALQQHLLVGRVDLWLRKSADAAVSLRPDNEGGPPFDAYTGARHVGDLEALRSLAASAGQRAVWLITSGECEAKPEYYRTPATQRTLQEWRRLAWYTGADGMTRVYRLEDGRPVRPPTALQ